MKKVTIELNNGTLEVSSLRDGKLLVGKYQGAKTNKLELLKALKKAGISTGYNLNAISMLANGSTQELPIAEAVIEDLPGEVNYPFEKIFSREEILKSVKTGQFENANYMQYVNEGQQLISVKSSPQTVIRFPDGKTVNLGKTEEQDLSYYTAENTSIDHENHTINANIEGCASKNTYGEVFVFPVTKVKSIGIAHGKVYFESAMEVEADIRNESDVETTSNIDVNGMIRGSYIRARGNVQGGFGLDNHKKLDVGIIEAGQSVFTTAIRNYKVWAGKYVIARTSIDNSIVQCLGTVVTPTIRSSEIRVGNKLYVRNIEGPSRIYLGAYYVEDSQRKDVLNFHEQHEKRLIDIETELAFVKERLLHERKNSIAQLNKLKRVSPQMIPNDMLLNKFYNNQVSALNDLKIKIEQYENQGRLIAQEKKRIALYEQQFKADPPLEVVITGTISAGSSIIAPNDKLMISSNLTNVSIQMNESTGKIIVEKLD